METFFKFCFGQVKSVPDFLLLFQSISQDKMNEKMFQLLTVQVSGLEPDNFDNLTCALVEFNQINPEFVCKIIDLLICECISDLKVIFVLNKNLSNFLFRDLIHLISRKF